MDAFSGLEPVRILEDQATEDRGEFARMSSFVGAVAVADLVKTTLGPKGMDKILQSVDKGNHITITNDGATILSRLYLDNPAARILVDISKVQDDEVGDGTTSVCVLAGELLREAEKLVQQKIHPQIIISGWREALTVSLSALEASSEDHAADSELFYADLLNIARTTLSSKVLNQYRDFFAEMAVKAVLKLKGSTNLDNIAIIKRSGGTLQDSFLDEDGFLLNKKFGVGQPKRIEDAKILIANTSMDTDKVKIYSTKVRVDSMEKVAQIEEAEKQKMRTKCQKILAHGCNVFINRQLIYNLPEQIFADAGVAAIEHADFDGIERLSKVLGGEIVSTFDTPDRVQLGACKLIEEVMIGEDQLIRFSGVKEGEACSIVLRGATDQLLDEAERSLHDALCVLSQTVKSSRTVLGGGCSEMLMSNAVEELAKQTSGKRAIAIEAFARALRALPTIISDNAGFDSSELVAQLRADHYQGKKTHGLDMNQGLVGDVKKLGITEAFVVKRKVVQSAAEAAEMILRVDDIVKCAPRQRR